MNNISKKILIPSTLIFTGTVILLVLLAGHQAKQQAIKTSIEHGINSVNQFKAIRGYYTKNVISKIQKNNMKANYIHKDHKDTVPLPATMIHELSSEFKAKMSSNFLNLYSSHPFPNRQNRTLDAFQVEAISTLNSNPDNIITEEITINGKPFIRIAIADKMVDDSCVKCHNSHPLSPKTDWKLGDVRGVLEMSISLREPIKLARADAYKNAILSLIAILIAAITTLLIIKHKLNVPLLNVIEKISEGSKYISNSIDDLTASAQTIKDSSKNQASLSNQANKEIEGVSSSAQRNAKDASSMKNAIINTNSSALESSQKLEKVVSSIEDIQRSSDEINNTVKVIEDIAFQINILSMNAAIEAARTKEDGESFSVVASEIKNLANESSQAALNIRRNLHESTSEINNGADLCKDVYNEIINVLSSINHIEKPISQIANSSNAQSQKLSTLNQCISNIDSASSNNFKQSELNASTIHSLNSQAKALQDVVKQLSSLVGKNN